MTKSLMIEIDEATKDIMTELQNGLTKNIESGISNSLQIVMQRQETNLEEIRDILNLHLATVTEDIEGIKKPIIRMARDVEQSIELLMDVKRLQKEQLEQLAQVGQQQLNNIQQITEQMIAQLAITQQTELAKSVQSFNSDASEVIAIFSENIQKNEEKISLTVLETEQRLQKQYNEFVQLNNQLSENKQKLQDETNSLKQTIAEQQTRFETMMSHVTQQFISFNDALQQKFNEHTRASLEQISHAVENNKTINALKYQVTSLEKNITNDIKEQAVVEKLATIERDLAYARLPFYKKWFTKREDF